MERETHNFMLTEIFSLREMCAGAAKIKSGDISSSIKLMRSLKKNAHFVIHLYSSLFLKGFEDFS